MAVKFTHLLKDGTWTLVALVALASLLAITAGRTVFVCRIVGRVLKFGAMIITLIGDYKSPVYAVVEATRAFVMVAITVEATRAPEMFGLAMVPKGVHGVEFLRYYCEFTNAPHAGLAKDVQTGIPEMLIARREVGEHKRTFQTPALNHSR